MTAPIGILALTEREIELFWGKVDKSTDCWLWTGALNNCNFGVARIHKKNYNAHRVSLFLDKGIFPRLGHVKHLCGNHKCVNPNHLSEVSFEFHGKGNRNTHNAALSKKKPLTFGEVSGEECVFIPLPDGSFGIADIEWAEFLERENCQISNGYMEINKSKVNPNRPRKFHRIVCSASDGLQVDHINGNKLDNRKSNLRVVTSMQNSWNLHKVSRLNKSGKTGVSWHNKSNQWRSRIVINRKRIELGLYSNLENAIKVRREAELLYYGDYAPKEV
jgi:hypothetical protein